MPSLKSIKKRITSVRNTQKITKAMKMVAAAKLRKAQTAAVNARHYTDSISKLAGRLSISGGDVSHPLATAHDKIARREYLVFTSDRGLCGGFNSNLLRKLGNELVQSRQQKIESVARVIGKKGKDYFKSKDWPLTESVTGLYEKLDRANAEEFAKMAIERFESGKTDEVWIGFNRFKSLLVQEITFKKILPISLPLTPSLLRRGEGEVKPIDYIYEPSARVVFDRVLREGVVAQIYQSFLESIASELAARMTAMDNATKNASDMIGYLTLQYNRARQASITKELMDIVSGAEALR